MRAEVPGQIEQGRDAIHVADGPSITKPAPVVFMM
jgi:hypothetical protein